MVDDLGFNDANRWARWRWPCERCDEGDENGHQNGDVCFDADHARLTTILKLSRPAGWTECA